MAKEINLMNLSKRYTTDFVISADGTQIGYRQIGAGPGLILVHGGMMYSDNFMKLAGLLADEFTVYIPDRRGRGLSGLHGDNYSLLAEARDIEAIVSKTKAQNIFGLSSGAIIVLQTALIESSLKKIALYEPPIPVNGTNPTIWVDDYEKAIKENNLAKAFISIVRGTGDSLLGKLPGFIIIPFMNFAIKADAKEKAAKGAEEVSLKTLILTMHYDPKAVLESEGIIGKCKNLTAEVLLLGGQKSQHYLKVALDALSSLIPTAKRVEFPGLGHSAADNGGRPKIVSKELKNFFRQYRTVE